MAVKVWFPGQGAVDFIRPRGSDISIPGAATIDDLRPADSTASLTKLLTQAVLGSKGFAIDDVHVVVVTEKGVERYPIAKKSNRFEAILEALKLAVSSL